MQFEHTIQIQASAARVFGLYADVTNWPSWDSDVKSATLNGQFASGSTGVIQPNGGPKSTLHFDQVRLNEGFVASCKLPMCTMRFEHEISPQTAAGVAVTHRVTFSGFLAPVFGRLIGSGMKKTLPHAMAGLKKSAEAVAA